MTSRIPISLLPEPSSQKGGLRAMHAVAADEGVSATTIWRRVKAGLLEKVNINGRAYITQDSLARFYERAAKGEFSQEPHGACAPVKKKVLTKPDCRME